MGHEGGGHGIGSLRVSMWQYDANFEPMYVPLTNLFEPNKKFQEAILSINISALTWFGLVGLNMRRRRRHTHGGLS